MIINNDKIEEYAELEMLQMVVDSYFEKEQRLKKDINELLESKTPSFKLKQLLHEKANSINHLGLKRCFDLIKAAERAVIDDDIHTALLKWEEFERYESSDLEVSIIQMNKVQQENKLAPIEMP